MHQMRRKFALDRLIRRNSPIRKHFARAPGFRCLHDMPYPDASFDLVVHSDTLEHVSQPIRALSECRRVLRAGGWLCFTVPTIVGRLSRSRAGLRKSFHGSASTGSDDYLVHTEFGADMWTFVVAAGFSSLRIHTVSFPDAIAISARK
jgi:SAM-dependent methyltransferase